MADVAVVILTYNEEMHISRAVASVIPFASQVFVIDSMSTDRTVQIARELGAVVISHAFVNQAKQFQWALDNAPISTGWVMRLDADEIVESDLAAEISLRVPRLPNTVTGVNLKRKHIFMGRWVRFGGRYPLLMLRIFRRGKGRVEDRWMDEHISVTDGDVVTFAGGFADHNLNDLAYFIDKHNKYATREAIETINQRYSLFSRDEALSARGSSIQAAFKRWVKERIYNHVPYSLSSLLYFLYRYLFQLGFLDGRSGLVYHFLQGYWYRFLVGARVMELDRAIVHLTNKDDMCAELSRLTGHRLTVDG